MIEINAGSSFPRYLVNHEFLSHENGNAMRQELIMSKLGPMPDASLRAMTEYGLSDQEIGTYFGLTPSTIRRLRRTLAALGSQPPIRTPDLMSQAVVTSSP